MVRTLHRGKNDKEKERQCLDRIGLLYFYEGDLTNANIFHRLAQYESEECFRENNDPTLFDYDKFKYELYVEIERKNSEELLPICTTKQTYNAIPKTPLEVPKLYKEFSKNSISKRTIKTSRAYNIEQSSCRKLSNRNWKESEANNQSTIKRLMYKSVRGIEKFKPLFLSTDFLSLKYCNQFDHNREIKDTLMNSPYNRNHYTHLSKDRKKMPTVTNIITEIKKMLLELVEEANKIL